MANRFSSWLSRPMALRTLFAQARLAYRLLREPRVPMLVKAIPILAVLYVIWPLDIVPDLFPVIGQLDDLGVALLALEMFTKMCPAVVRSFHQEAILRGRAYTRMDVDVVRGYEGAKVRR
ncbi:MAG TPA: DUF1232 domain-containing protein [Vicinamibacterales bacterium]|nr:DUF1232 domain-containing protein [Vicinamibacterales bacterium]